MEDQMEWWFALSYFARLAGYVVILGMLAGLVTFVLKILEDCDLSRNPEEETTINRETSPLWSEKVIQVTYGTCEEDLESGSCSNGSREELYDGKLCIICFDEERNCFFVPCGHCATCNVCAQRISEGENKTCPVCRRFIGKVRKLFSL